MTTAPTRLGELSAGPNLRDVLAAAAWILVPIGFVLAIDAVGIPYEPLPGQPEKDPSYAIVMYTLLAVGGALGSLFGLGQWLVPGRLLAGRDFVMLFAALRGAAPSEEIAAYGRTRLLRAGLVLVLAALVVGLAVVLRERVYVPVIAGFGLTVLACLALFASTCQRAARRGLDPSDWLVPAQDDVKGLAALAVIPAGRGRAFSDFVWRHRLVWFLSLASVFAVADQASKVWAQGNLTTLGDWNRTRNHGGKLERVKERGFQPAPSREVHVVDHAFSFKYAENPAAAFSLTGSLPEWVRRPFLVGVSTSAMLFIGLWFFLQRRPDGLLMTAFALITAGAIGNLIDRIRFGYVIDFINWYAGFINPKYIWPTFNIADTCIVLGALTVVYRTMRPLYPEFEPEPDAQSESTDADGTSAKNRPDAGRAAEGKA